MKILFVTQNIAPFRIDWLNELAKEFEIEIFHLNEYDQTCNPKFLEKINVGLKVKDISRCICGYKIFKLKEIQRAKYDVLILDGYGFLGQILLIFYLKMMKKRFILSMDGAFLTEKEPVFKKLIKKICINSADAFFSTSERTDTFLTYYLKNKSKKIYRHNFSSVFSNDIIDADVKKTLYKKYRKELGLEGKTVVLCVGRFIKLKRFEIILKASKYLSEKYVFYFIGGHPLDSYLELVDSTNRDRIVFVDFVYPDELKKYYIVADMFCLPTEKDVWGLVIGEAMSMGVPIIASDMCNAAVAMVEEKGGIIITDDNPKSYARACMTIAENKELAEMMIKHNIDTIRKYAIDVAAKDDIDNIYDYVKRK